MKKIKLLHSFIILLIILFSIHFATNIYLIFYSPYYGNLIGDSYNFLIFGFYTQFIGFVFSLISFIALFFIKSGLYSTLKNGYFNKVSSKKFKIAGRLFFISGSLSLTWDVFLLFYTNGETLFEGISSNILLIFIGFSLLIISDFINNGNVLKQENDLTI
ncbi:MAG: DUF2975 domain-containing protein [Winogradskyella sp.]|uniref:hypothetical protein n=1 Tax=Winogradskyella sp. TaxID=1883156 RepID=UPI00181FF562|nr:hypothetical protein [Winogradskyella sp.]MBT8244596.1 DUF2975 domain-containing protein [Winogradskyella sp.]NNK22672.1 DUF2975 domain-containing protein [Winogradskyella sp.]